MSSPGHSFHFSNIRLGNIGEPLDYDQWDVNRGNTIEGTNIRNERQIFNCGFDEDIELSVRASRSSSVV